MSTQGAGGPLVIGVAGGSGSGKTTVSQAIVQRVGAQHIAYLPHDLYYYDLSHLPLDERSTRNFDHPDSLDNDLLVEHIDTLLRGEPIPLPGYDFADYTRLPSSQTVEPRSIILVEGILIFADPALRSRMHIKLYVDTEADMRFIRRIERDVAERGRSLESVISQYLSTVRPMHLEFVEPSKRYADIIIPKGGQNRIAVDMVVAQVESMLAHVDISTSTDTRR